MGDRITVSGTVDAAPRGIRTAEGLTVASFRLRSRLDPGARVRLPPGATAGCYVVTALDDLASGVDRCLRSGDRIVVSGTLVLRQGSDPLDLVAELHAETIGRDSRTGERPTSAEEPGRRENLS